MRCTSEDGECLRHTENIEGQSRIYSGTRNKKDNVAARDWKVVLPVQGSQSDDATHPQSAACGSKKENRKESNRS